MGALQAGGRGRQVTLGGRLKMMGSRTSGAQRSTRKLRILHTFFTRAPSAAITREAPGGGGTGLRVWLQRLGCGFIPGEGGGRRRPGGLLLQGGGGGGGTQGASSARRPPPPTSRLVSPPTRLTVSAPPPAEGSKKRSRGGGEACHVPGGAAPLGAGGGGARGPLCLQGREGEAESPEGE